MNKINELIDIIYKIKNYDYSSSVDPKCINLILGEKNNGEGQEYEKYGKISFYRKFGEFAIFSRKKVKINSTETKIFSLLFNTDFNDSKWAMDTIKSANLLQKFVDYLYYEHHILFLNKCGKCKLFNNLFGTTIVDNILILGSEKNPQILKYVFKTSTNVKVVRIPHPSPRNAWYISSDSWSNGTIKIINSSDKFESDLPKANLDSFILKL